MSMMGHRRRCSRPGGELGLSLSLVAARDLYVFGGCGWWSFGVVVGLVVVFGGCGFGCCVWSFGVVVVLVVVVLVVVFGGR